MKAFLSFINLLLRSALSLKQSKQTNFLLSPSLVICIRDPDYQLKKEAPTSLNKKANGLPTPSHHYDRYAAAEDNGSSSSDSGEQSWEWVYYDEVDCLSCSSSDEEGGQAAQNGLSCDDEATQLVQANAASDQWEYYDEMDVYPAADQQDPYYDQQQLYAEEPVTTYDTFRTPKRTPGMPQVVPHGTYPQDPLHYGHSHSTQKQTDSQRQQRQPQGKMQGRPQPARQGGYVAAPLQPVQKPVKQTKKTQQKRQPKRASMPSQPSPTYVTKPKAKPAQQRQSRQTAPQTQKPQAQRPQSQRLQAQSPQVQKPQQQYAGQSPYMTTPYMRQGAMSYAQPQMYQSPWGQPSYLPVVKTLKEAQQEEKQAAKMLQKGLPVEQQPQMMYNPYQMPAPAGYAPVMYMPVQTQPSGYMPATPMTQGYPVPQAQPMQLKPVQPSGPESTTRISPSKPSSEQSYPTSKPAQQPQVQPTPQRQQEERQELRLLQQAPPALQETYEAQVSPVPTPQQLTPRQPTKAMVDKATTRGPTSRKTEPQAPPKPELSTPQQPPSQPRSQPSMTQPAMPQPMRQTPTPMPEPDVEPPLPPQPAANPKVLSPLGQEVPASLSALIGFESQGQQPRRAPLAAPYMPVQAPQLINPYGIPAPQTMQPAYRMPSPAMLPQQQPVPMAAYQTATTVYPVAPQAYPSAAPSFAAGGSRPGQPMVDVRVSPHDPTQRTQPYNYNVPITVDAGYEASPDFGAIQAFDPSSLGKKSKKNKKGKQKQPKMSPLEKQFSKQKKQKSKRKATEQQKGVMSFDSFFDEAGTFNEAVDSSDEQQDDFMFEDDLWDDDYDWTSPALSHYNDDYVGENDEEPLPSLHDLLDSSMREEHHERDELDNLTPEVRQAAKDYLKAIEEQALHDLVPHLPKRDTESQDLPFLDELDFDSDQNDISIPLTSGQEYEIEEGDLSERHEVEAPHGEEEVVEHEALIEAHQVDAGEEEETYNGFSEQDFMNYVIKLVI